MGRVLDFDFDAIGKECQVQDFKLGTEVTADELKAGLGIHIRDEEKHGEWFACVVVAADSKDASMAHVRFKPVFSDNCAVGGREEPLPSDKID